MGIVARSTSSDATILIDASSALLHLATIASAEAPSTATETKGMARVPSVLLFRFVAACAIYARSCYDLSPSRSSLLT